MILGLKGTGTLGDALWLTPAIWGLLDRGIDVKVQMHDDAQCRAVAAVYDNLCPVEFVDNPPERLYIINKDKTHSAQRVLNELKLDNVSCIPKIIVTKEEIEWAKNFLGKQNKQPIAIINNNSGNTDPNNIRAKYVCPPSDFMQFLVDKLDGQFNFLQFGRDNDDKFTPLKNVTHIRGLSIRQLAACYKVIHNMLSGDTGDYHLMLAVGGRASVFVPRESKEFGYIYSDLHYTPYLWRETCRVQYSRFDDRVFLYQ